VPAPSGVRIQSPSSDVGDENPNFNWTVDIGGGFVKWSTDTSVNSIGDGSHDFPAQLPTLDWGTLYAFSFTSAAPPATGNAVLHVATAGSPASYEVQTLVPSAGTR
jgi:hypothetical protein